MNNKTSMLVGWISLLLVAWPVDRIVESIVLRLPPKSLLRALDTFVHGLIGGSSYWIACVICPHLVLNVSLLLSCFGFGPGRKKVSALQEAKGFDVLYSCGIAFMISCGVDLDHIIKDVLQSLRIGQSLGQWERGWLHFSLPPLSLAFMMYLSALLFHSLWCIPCGSLCILSIISHHIRDGVHHGLQFYPLGTTPKIPYWLYVVITLVLPLLTGELSSSIVRKVISPVENSLEIV